MFNSYDDAVEAANSERDEDIQHYQKLKESQRKEWKHRTWCVYTWGGQEPMTRIYPDIEEAE